MEEARDTQEQSLLVSMLLSMPAATALIALAVPIVRVLFERGAFGAVATVETAEALVGFAVGLPAFVLIRVLQPGFFAREDTRDADGLRRHLGGREHRRCRSRCSRASSTPASPSRRRSSAWINALMLAVWLARRGHFRLTARASGGGTR